VVVDAVAVAVETVLVVRLVADTVVVVGVPGQMYWYWLSPFAAEPVTIEKKTVDAAASYTQL
jgi:hypothetical protein